MILQHLSRVSRYFSSSVFVEEVSIVCCTSFCTGSSFLYDIYLKLLSSVIILILAINSYILLIPEGFVHDLDVENTPPIQRSSQIKSLPSKNNQTYTEFISKSCVYLAVTYFQWEAKSNHYSNWTSEIRGFLNRKVCTSLNLLNCLSSGTSMVVHIITILRKYCLHTCRQRMIAIFISILQCKSEK